MRMTIKGISHEIAGREVDLTVECTYVEPEPRTRHDPGCGEDIEDVEFFIDGQMVTSDDLNSMLERELFDEIMAKIHDEFQRLEQENIDEGR